MQEPVIYTSGKVYPPDADPGERAAVYCGNVGVVVGLDRNMAAAQVLKEQRDNSAAIASLGEGRWISYSLHIKVLEAVREALPKSHLYPVEASVAAAAATLEDLQLPAVMIDRLGGRLLYVLIAGDGLPVLSQTVAATSTDIRRIVPDCESKKAIVPASIVTSFDPNDLEAGDLSVRMVDQPFWRVGLDLLSDDLELLLPEEFAEREKLAAEAKLKRSLKVATASASATAVLWLSLYSAGLYFESRSVEYSHEAVQISQRAAVHEANTYWDRLKKGHVKFAAPLTEVIRQLPVGWVVLSLTLQGKQLEVVVGPEKNGLLTPGDRQALIKAVDLAGVPISVSPLGISGYRLKFKL